MRVEDHIADRASRFATVAMRDRRLRGQKALVSSLEGIARAGMDTAPAQLAPDWTDAMPTIPGVNDAKGDVHDDPLQPDPAATRRLPWSRPGDALLVLSRFTRALVQLWPRAILKSVLERVGAADMAPKSGTAPEGLRLCPFDARSDQAVCRIGFCQGRVRAALCRCLCRHAAGASMMSFAARCRMSNRHASLIWGDR